LTASVNRSIPLSISASIALAVSFSPMYKIIIRYIFVVRASVSFATIYTGRASPSPTTDVLANNVRGGGMYVVGRV
jgi:hypothetical protein